MDPAEFSRMTLQIDPAGHCTGFTVHHHHVREERTIIERIPARSRLRTAALWLWRLGVTAGVAWVIWKVNHA